MSSVSSLSPLACTMVCKQVYVSRSKHCTPERANGDVFPARGAATATRGKGAAGGTKACTPHNAASRMGRTTLLTLL